MKEIIPGIYQLPIPIPDNPLGHINAYLIRGDGEVMLVDSGWNAPVALDALDDQLRRLGLGFRQINRLLITHIHPDHYGLAGKIQEMSGAELIIHQLENAFIEGRILKVDRLVEDMKEWLRTNGVPTDVIGPTQRSALDMLALVAPARPDRLLADGETLSVGGFHFEVLWTPGHSAGHICLYERAEQILISGDHLLPKITPNVALRLYSRTNPLADYLDSLSAIEHLPTHLVLPGHQAVFADAGKRAGEIRRHHRARSQQIWDAIGDHEATGHDIASRIPWMNGKVLWEKMAFLHRRFAVLETLAHLEKLRAEDRVEKAVRNSVIFYARKPERAAG